MTPKDKQTLRELGARVAQIAALPEQTTRLKMWQHTNALRPDRPMLKIEELPWHEMDTDGSLRLTVADPFWQGVECHLRRTLYKWERVRADMVVLPHIQIPRAISSTGFGLEVEENILAEDSANHIVSHHYHSQLQTQDDILKIVTPKVTEDKALTAQREAQAHELFDGALEVQMMGVGVNWVMWDDLVRWMGPEQMMIDAAERPEFLNALMERLTGAHMELLTTLEQKGFLDNRFETAHCAYTFEEGRQLSPPGQVKASECWAHGTAQIFSSIGKRMHREFEFEHVRPLYARIHAANYGCCEPLSGRIDLVRSLPNVRKVSISPWSDIDQVAQEMGGDYVMSRKPNPAYVAGTVMDWDAVRAEISVTLDACKRSGTPVEFILKDISTVRYQPQRLYDYAKIVGEMCERAAE